jgi:hypothetical protein
LFTTRLAIMEPGALPFSTQSIIAVTESWRSGAFEPTVSVPSARGKHVGAGQRAFAVAPQNFLDNHRFAVAAIDTPHRVQQKAESPRKE